MVEICIVTPWVLVTPLPPTDLQWCLKVMKSKTIHQQIIKKERLRILITSTDPTLDSFHSPHHLWLAYDDFKLGNQRGKRGSSGVSFERVLVYLVLNPIETVQN